MVRFIALAATVLTLSIAAPASAAVPSTRFVDFLGVNTHWDYLDPTGGYHWRGDPIPAVAVLGDIGIKHMRSGVFHPPTTSLGKLKYIHDTLGVQIMGGCGTLWVGDEQGCVNLARDQIGLGAFDTFEGVNEPNCVTNSSANIQLGIGNSARLATAATGTGIPTATASMCWVGPSPWTNAQVAGKFPANDYANVHPYAGGTFDSPARLQQILDAARAMTGKQDVIAGEVGYKTGCAGGQPFVTEDQQRDWTMAELLMMLKQGWKRAYLYELVDLFPQCGADNRWGLVRNDYTYKPVATTLKNFLALLQDDDAPAAGPDAALTINDPAGPGKLDTMQFRKHDGSNSYWVAIYPLSPNQAPRTITLTRPAGTTYSWKYVQPWKDTTGRSPVTFKDSYSVPVEGDQTVLVRFSPR